MELILDFVDFKPKVICEVGVFNSNCIHSLGLMNSDTKMILVEPNPKCFSEIHKKFSNDGRFVLHQKAISDIVGKIKLYNRPEKNGEDASGFIEGLASCPAIVNDGYQIDESHALLVDTILMSDIDNGDIDVLCVDTEGAEWLVIKNLISRPKVITLETHGIRYTNPYITEINQWMIKNGYKPVGRDKSDTVFKL